MAKRKPKSPIEGRWNIVSMTEWDGEFLHEEVQAFIEFARRIADHLAEAMEIDAPTLRT